MAPVPYEDSVTPSSLMWLAAAMGLVLSAAMAGSVAEAVLRRLTVWVHILLPVRVVQPLQPLPWRPRGLVSSAFDCTLALYMACLVAWLDPSRGSPMSCG